MFYLLGMTFVQWLDRLLRSLIYSTTAFHDTYKNTDQTRNHRDTDTATTTTAAATADTTLTLTSTTTAMHHHHHHHHRPSSPLFDISGFFSSSRRIKPLPKRRRTLNPEENVDANASVNNHKNQNDEDAKENSNSNSNSEINPAQSATMNADSTYPVPSSSSTASTMSKNLARISGDVVSPGIDPQQRSHFHWPDLLLSEEILRVASALPARDPLSGIDDDDEDEDVGGVGGVGGGGIGIGIDSSHSNAGDGGGDDGDIDEAFLSERQTTTATPPPPSETSSYDGDSPQLTQTTFRPSSFYRSARQFIRERLNLDEPFDPEFTEGNYKIDSSYAQKQID